MQSSFTAANTYSSSTPVGIIILKSVSKSEVSWPKSSSFRTRVHMDSGIIKTSAILLWQSLALPSTSFLRILVYWVMLPQERSKHLELSPRVQCRTDATQTPMKDFHRVLIKAHLRRCLSPRTHVVSDSFSPPASFENLVP